MRVARGGQLLCHTKSQHRDRTHARTDTQRQTHQARLRFRLRTNPRGLLVLSGFCFTTIQNSFVRPTTWRYLCALEMADAARPTHRPHARTPLTRARTHNSQCNSFESWPSRRSSSLGELGNSIVDLGATVHARRIACMEPFSAWWAGPWLG